MKNKSKKYIAGGFIGILCGIRTIYGYLPHEISSDVLAENEVGSQAITADVVAETTETSPDESHEVVLLATTTKDTQTHPTTATSVIAKATPTSTSVSPKKTVSQGTETPVVSTQVAKANRCVDGVYTGTRENAYYGYVQVQVTCKTNAITNVVALEFPDNQQRSQKISAYAIPKLQKEALVAQRGTIDAVSGASYTSKAFADSRSNALEKATAYVL